MAQQKTDRENEKNDRETDRIAANPLTVAEANDLRCPLNPVEKHRFVEFYVSNIGEVKESKDVLFRLKTEVEYGFSADIMLPTKTFRNLPFKNLDTNLRTSYHIPLCGMTYKISAYGSGYGKRIYIEVISAAASKF